MFNDVFDFGKKRNLKEATIFFVFHGTLVVAAMTILKIFGL